MPLYNYLCLDCRGHAELVKGDRLAGDELFEVLFETSHGMQPSGPELLAARECPRCGGTNTEKTCIGVQITSYVRGYGYLDRDGCHRDMNLRKLTGVDEETGRATDPYAEYRTSGEVDELKVRLSRAGRHDPAPKRFLGASTEVPQGDWQGAVRAATDGSSEPDASA